MYKLILLIFLVGCGNKPLVNVPKKVEVDIPKRIVIEHKINFDAINEFCESVNSTNSEIDNCITDLLNAIRSVK